MASQLKIQFDANQEHQLDAIQAVVKLFDGLPKHVAQYALNEDTIPNLPPYSELSESWLLDNLQAVQATANIPYSFAAIAFDEGLVLDGAGAETWRFPSFTVEMETGTGKTYVYLRTIYELRQHYGFSKFIIVVPSIAIYQGVVKNFQITRDHFRALYGNEVVNLVQYEGAQLSRLRGYSASSFVEVMVITLDSFNKTSNNIYKPSEKLPGERRPFQYIQDTRPIMILDEPQNMESGKAKEAIRTLHPLFALRYSATHRTSPNLIYRLTPFEAYRRNLVKKIQVCGVTERDNFNTPFLALEDVVTRPEIRAKIRTYVAEGLRTREVEVTLKQGEDLYSKTKREEHMGGYKVAEISAVTSPAFVRFTNGITLSASEEIGPSRPDIFRVQIEKTIEQHIEMQEKLRPKGIKVLSLFFIDRVANYTDEKGLIKTIFDDAFKRLRSRYAPFKSLEPSEVREAYFAKVRTKSGEEQAIDSEGRNNTEREAEKAAFELIMQKKEQLLSFDEKVCFIFAHSALKEGWDNPNVFQVCTLNQTVSEVKKRQEIGRGLRLCVNQRGERVLGEAVNILTVVANESYKTYAANLQREYTEAGDAAPPPPSDATKQHARRNDAIFKSSKDFQAFWNKLIRNTIYEIQIDTPKLIEECLERLNNCRYPESVIVVERGHFVVTDYTISLVSVTGATAKLHIKITDTAHNNREQTLSVSARDDLAKILKDPNLRGFQVVMLVESITDPVVVFDNKQEARLRAPVHFQSEAGQKPHERAVRAPVHTYPVPNLLARAARETGLTRPTLNTIFKGISEKNKATIFKNPEGFVGLFISEVQNALADHIVDRIQYTADGATVPLDAEELFPKAKQFPQKELIDAGPTGLYDLIQVDSDEERHFVQDRLKPDTNVLFYFKFPPVFKVRIPKAIGNYNPDWGIVRMAEGGKVKLELVRETKGALDEEALRFPHEARKIKCAKKHFTCLGIDYRHVTSKVATWWAPSEETPRLK